MSYICFAPAGLTIDFNSQPLIPQYNRSRPQVVNDNLYYLISLISIKSVESDFNGVHLHSDILKRIIKDYAKYISYLSSIELITVSKSYNPGTKSKLYNLSNKYQGVNLDVIHHITNQNFLKRIQNPNPEFTKYGHLTKFFESNLSYDELLANEILDKLKIEGKLLAPKEYHLLKLNKLKSTRPKFSAGITNRLYTPLTNIKSELRHTLLYKGEKLVEIDIVNSLPFILSCLLKGDLIMNNSVKEILNKYINNIYINVGQISENPDVIKFHSLIADGTLYDFLESEWSRKLGKPYNRKLVKKRFNSIINQIPRYPDCKEKAILRTLFPSIIFFIDELYTKRKDKRSGHPLPLILQSIESHFVLDVVCSKLVTLFPEMPVLSIHDAVMIPSNYVNQVSALIISESIAFYNTEINLKIESLI
jgi:hypothetical protein